MKDLLAIFGIFIITVVMALVIGNKLFQSYFKKDIEYLRQKIEEENKNYGRNKYN